MWLFPPGPSSLPTSQARSIPAAPRAPRTPTTGLEQPWPAEVWLLPPLPPWNLELVEQPPPAPVILPLTSACLVGSVCLSVCPIGLSWCEQGWGSQVGSTPILPLWGSGGIIPQPQTCSKVGQGDTHAAGAVLPTGCCLGTWQGLALAVQSVLLRCPGCGHLLDPALRPPA